MAQLQKFALQLQHNLDNVTREAALIATREKEQNTKFRALQRELKTERDEKRKMRLEVQHLRKQFNHESKRKETELNRLKEKLHQTLADKTQDKRWGIEILNFLQKVGGVSQLQMEERTQEEEKYDLIEIDYDGKQKEILAENTALRQCLSDVYQLLVKSSEVVNGSSSEISKEEVTRRKSNDFDGLFHKQFTCSKEEIESKFRDVIVQLKDRIQTESLNNVFVQEFELPTSFESKKFESELADCNCNFKELAANFEKLEKDFSQCRHIIAGQEKIIQAMNDGYTKDALEKVLQTFNASEELDNAKERMKLIREQEEKFNEERINFTQYVVKMSKEKEKFEKERMEFYKHCISTPVMNAEARREKRKDSSITKRSSQDSLLKKISLNEATKKFSDSLNKEKAHSTPISLSKKINKCPTPSTAELYKFLSLTYDDNAQMNCDVLLNGSYIEVNSPDDIPHNDFSNASLFTNASVFRCHRGVDRQ